MSTHNIQFLDKIRKKIQIFVFLSYWKNFVGTEKRVRIIHGKRAIRVRAIAVILYKGALCDMFHWLSFNRLNLLCFDFV